MAVIEFEPRGQRVTAVKGAPCHWELTKYYLCVFDCVRVCALWRIFKGPASVPIYLRVVVSLIRHVIHPGVPRTFGNACLSRSITVTIVFDTVNSWMCSSSIQFICLR